MSLGYTVTIQSKLAVDIHQIKNTNRPRNSNQKIRSKYLNTFWDLPNWREIVLSNFKSKLFQTKVIAQKLAAPKTEVFIKIHYTEFMKILSARDIV